MTIDVRRAADRLSTRTDWLDSRHSFSFGTHYDPENTHFGLLLVSNDDVVAAGTGFDEHPHRDMEIVTWVLEGALEHRDSAGNFGTLTPGLAQRMSAGTGILHSERNAGDVPVRFVQMWVAPDPPGGTPGYAQLDVADALASGGLVTVASGRPDRPGAVPIRQRAAALHAARLAAGGSVTLPAAPYVHLYVARGAADLETAGPLAEGDAARVTGGDGQRVTAVEPAEILVWEMHAAVR